MSNRSVGMILEPQPAWVQEYENPVIETAAGTRHKNIHAPDRTAAEPRPACVGRGLPETDWIAKELNGGLAAFRQPCSSDECLQELARTARELQARFDG